LETALGVKLLMRDRSGVATTEPGELFLKRVERALSLLQTGCQRASLEGGGKNAKSDGSFDHMLTIQQLSALIAISDTGNFSMAARAMGLSQPSVHRLARDLERSAQITLFQRHAKGIALTPAAEVLGQFSQLAFSEIEQGFQELDEGMGRGAGRLTIGTLPLVRTDILPRAINEFTRNSPDTQISVIDGPYDDLLYGLRHGSVDFILGALREDLPVSDVVQESLFSDRLGIFARKDHPLSGSKKISKSDLAEFPWVIPRPGTPTRRYFDHFFDRGTDAPTRVLEASSLILVRGLLSDSDRLTMISRNQIIQELESGQVEQLAVELDDEPRDIGITKRLEWYPTAEQQRFLDTIEHVVGSTKRLK
jgi:DNA-binding transcriptional LysR family regulator